MFEKPIDDDVDIEKSPSWLANSYQTIEHWNTGNYRTIDKEYQKRFNVKLIYTLDGEDDDHTIHGVSFPSESDATMFILRWA